MGYKLNFSAGSAAHRIYQALQADGVSDEYINQGYKSGDKILEEQDVFRTVFNNYQKFKAVVKSTFAVPALWDLDDQNPTTTFDDEIKNRVQKSIQSLSEILIKSGLKHGSREFNRKLAIGLFYFVDTPDDPLAIEEASSLFKQRTSELDREGLSEFKEYLKQSGGLGTGTFFGFTEMELSALEAIQLKRGKCTEKSGILFSVLEMAGLQPTFVTIDWHDAKKALLLAKEEMQPESVGENHIAIEVRFGKAARIFDLTRDNPQFQFKKYRRLHPSEMFAIQVCNASNYLTFNFRKLDQAANAAKIAIAVSPSLACGYSNIGSALYMSKNDDEAEVQFKKAMSLDPKLPYNYSMLGLVYISKGELQNAEKMLRRAVAIEPDYTKAHANLSLLFKKLGRIDEAIDEARIIVRVLPVSPEGYMLLGNALVAGEYWLEGVTAYLGAIQRGASGNAVHNNLATCHLMLGQHDEAIAEYANALLADSSNQVTQNGLQTALSEKYIHNADARRIFQDTTLNVNAVVEGLIWSSIYWRLGQKEKASATLDGLSSALETFLRHPAQNQLHKTFLHATLTRTLASFPMDCTSALFTNVKFSAAVKSLGNNGSK